jgi:sugar/nucleoside kinase (ribokinase family)
MWDTPRQERAARTAIDIARSAGAKISFDIADPFVVERYRDALVEFLPGRVDLLFGNAEELGRLTGVDGYPEEIALAARAYAATVALKIGKNGCVIADRDGARRVGAFLVETRDTTGAGDAFAGGFLYGYLAGAQTDRCARLANRLASAIVTVFGCRYDELDIECVIREGLGRSPG